jgi:hypothetical protein
MSNFNIAAFLDDAKKVHLNTGDTLPVDNVKERLDEFIDYDRSLFSRVLDDICSNVVGNMMFTLLMMNLPSGQRLKIINIGPEQTRTGNPLVDQEGSSYADYDVWVNLNVYDSSGIGIPYRQYYCVDENKNISLKPKSLSGSIFHEFTHCLHHVEDSGRYDRECRSAVPKPWDTKEERRTISGYIDPDVFDPICDNCFHLYDSIVSGKPYMPRIGHCGYRSNNLSKDKDNRTKLSAYLLTPESKEIIENWEEYTIK